MSHTTRTHYFHPANDPERRKWQDPEAIMHEIGLKSGMTFADIGAGSGFFAIPAAKIVGDTGLVYALDISAEAVNALKEVARKGNLQNITTIVGEAGETAVCEACADIVFFANVLHDFSQPGQVLQNGRKMLKASGKLVDLDWKTDAPFGPPIEIRFSEEKASRLIEAAGFKILSVKDSGQYHYLIEAALGDEGKKRL